MNFIITLLILIFALIKIKIYTNSSNVGVYNSKNININDYINTLNDFLNK